MKIKERAAKKHVYIMYSADLESIFVGLLECATSDFIAGFECAKKMFQDMQEHDKDLNAFDCMSLGEEEE